MEDVTSTRANAGSAVGEVFSVSGAIQHGSLLYLWYNQAILHRPGCLRIYNAFVIFWCEYNGLHGWLYTPLLIEQSQRACTRLHMFTLMNKIKNVVPLSNGEIFLRLHCWSVVDTPCYKLYHFAFVFPDSPFSQKHVRSGLIEVRNNGWTHTTNLDRHSFQQTESSR